MGRERGEAGDIRNEASVGGSGGGGGARGAYINKLRAESVHDVKLN